jgi:thiamine biosynthesis protein ThiS
MTPETTTAATIRVQLNGSSRDLPSGLSVRDLLVSLELRPELVVAEVNREILPRESYAERDLAEGDVIELVHFVGGG